MDEPEDKGLLEQLFVKRDAQSERRSKARNIVRESEAVLEKNRQGIMRWYVHPSFDDLVDNNTLVYRYEIPPHSRTGTQHRQGNMVSFVLSGHGYTEVYGTKHEWEEGDVIGLPALPNGVVFCHVNESDETALLLTAEPNLYDVLGVEMGAGFVQLNDAPETGN